MPEGLRRQATGTTGTTIAIGALPAGEIPELAAALGVPQLSGRSAGRLHAHTAGNPLYITTLLAELPHDRWQTWEPMLPAPRTFATQVTAQIGGMQSAGAQTGRGRRRPRSKRDAGINRSDRRGARSDRRLDEATAVNLLKVPDESTGVRGVMSPIHWCRRQCTGSSDRRDGPNSTRPRPSSSKTQRRFYAIA